MKDALIKHGIVGHILHTGINKVLLTVILAVQLAACGGGGGGDASSSAADGAADIASAVKVSGSVGDGPVTGAAIVVYADNGDELGAMTSDNTASFQSTIKARGRDYPLLIKSTGGFDLVTGTEPAFEMLSVMLGRSDKQQNINPFTTLIVKTAQSLPGGLNADNVEAARAVVMDKLGFGLDPNLIPDPITTSITASKAANIIKASEVLAEMVRRTSTTVSAVGSRVTADGVMAALAADLTDGFLDGKGARGTDARVAAVATVVSAQVLVEALGNVLEVEGVVATGMLDEAIGITQPGISSSQLTAGVRISAGMLQQAKIALAAARVLDSSSQVADIATGVGAIAPNALPADVVGVLSADASTYLGNAVVLSATATTQQMASIGQAVHGTGSTSGTGSTGGTGNTGSTGSGSTVAANRAPAISGTPGGSVVAGSGYSFQPSATDADGDALSFSISNKPAWASFSGSTGRLSGTPGTGSVGSYGNIVISVSDGTASASLPAFSIRVNATTTSVQTGTVTLNWTAPTKRADGTPLSLADIDGYRIHYGKTAGSYTSQVNVADGTAQKVNLTDLPAGTYYLVMTTYDVNGRQSGNSSMVTKSVP